METTRYLVDVGDAIVTVGEVGNAEVTEGGELRLMREWRPCAVFPPGRWRWYAAGPSGFYAKFRCCAEESRPDVEATSESPPKVEDEPVAPTPDVPAPFSFPPFATPPSADEDVPL